MVPHTGNQLKANDAEMGNGFVESDGTAQIGWSEKQYKNKYLTMPYMC